MKIIQLGDPLLRKKAKAVSPIKLKTKKFQKLISDLIRTCDSKNGVGIAAPQVGNDDRVFIVWSRPNKRYPKAPKFGPTAVVNAKIISGSKQKVKDWEGCLSIPGIRGLVSREKWIEIEYIDRAGKKIVEKHKDFVARIFQHELDHLNGIVFLDRVDPKDLVTEAEYKKIIKKRK